MLTGGHVAEVLGRLLRENGRSDGKSFALRDIASACSEWLEQNGLEGRVSPEYIRNLCNGTNPNPRLYTLWALADFFGYSPAIFADPVYWEQVKDDLEQARRIGASGVRSVAARGPVSPALRRLVIELAEQLQEDDPEPSR